MCDDRLLYRMHCPASPPQPHLANCRKRFVLTTYSLNLADFRTINLMMKFYEGLWDLIWHVEKWKRKEKKMFHIYKNVFRKMSCFGGELKMERIYGSWSECDV